jgi:hypothetical protein
MPVLSPPLGATGRSRLAYGRYAKLNDEGNLYGEQERSCTVRRHASGANHGLTCFAITLSVPEQSMGSPFNVKIAAAMWRRGPAACRPAQPPLTALNSLHFRLRGAPLRGLGGSCSCLGRHVHTITAQVRPARTLSHSGLRYGRGRKTQQLRAQLAAGLPRQAVQLA